MKHFIFRAFQNIKFSDPKLRNTPFDIHKFLEEYPTTSPTIFSNHSVSIIPQKNKQRTIHHYENKLSHRNIINYAIKLALDKNFQITYPNRQNIIHSLFAFLPILSQLQSFSIYKFDFHNFFASNSSKYIFNKYIRNKCKSSEIRFFINSFTTHVDTTFRGLPTSNAFIEIIGHEFDLLLKKELNARGFNVMFFQRYVDDVLLIIRDFIDQEQLEQIINNTIDLIFHKDKENLVTLNKNKCQIIQKLPASLGLGQFDFLGYEFFFNFEEKKTSIQIGISAAKRTKFLKKIKKAIRSCFPKGTSFATKQAVPKEKLEYLRWKILGFTHRLVYLKQKKNSIFWVNQGFIANYNQFSKLIQYKKTDIHQDTLDFFNLAITQAFDDLHVEYPYFLKQNKSNKYKLTKTLRKNKALIFNPCIGYGYQELSKIAQVLDIPLNQTNYSYADLRFFILQKLLK